MKRVRKKRWILLGLGCLILGMSAGCGHGTSTGEEQELAAESGFDQAVGHGPARAAESGYKLAAEGERIQEKEESNEKRNESETEEAGASKKESGESESILQQDAAAHLGTVGESGEHCAAESTTVLCTDADPEGSAKGDASEATGTEMEKPGVNSQPTGEAQKNDDAQREDAATAAGKAQPEPYYLTAADKSEVLAQLAAMGQSYGLTYYPEVSESETWDSPTPIYEEELLLGREHVMGAMVDYTEGAFVLMQMEGCQGFALSIKEQPNTVTDAYYEVYVYWM